MRVLLVLIISFFTLTSGISQYNITFDIKNYESDSVVIGYYIMDKQLVQDSLIRNDKGQFVLSGQDTLESGVYLLLTQPDNEYIQFVVNESEKDFKVIFDYKEKSKVKFKNSPDNKIFQDYVEYLAKVRPKAQSLRDTIEACKAGGTNFESFEQLLKEIDDSVVEKQEEIIENFPGSISALLIKANREIEIPDFEDAEDPNLERYLYYKKHYFNNLELSNPASLRTPFLFKRIDYYLNKLTPSNPDSINVAIDSILSWLKPAGESYNYYLSHFLNSYGSSKIVGFDAVYVHLVDKYYAKGEAPWVSDENLEKIIDNANRIRPVLLGKTGPDITVYDEMNNPVSISDIDYEYLVLLFWAPDCGHCKKSMPKFIEFQERWKDRGVKVFAICTKHKDKINDCWEYVHEKDMHGFINGADEFHRSRFKLKYNVQNTPKVFILDKDREILMKNIGAEQMDRVMEEILKQEVTEK